jgi:oligoribonuclease NrnB/cAMP/cGMP phosphodiesterase (DHH superfamily)
MIITHSDLDGFVSALAVMQLKGIAPARVHFFGYSDRRDATWQKLLAEELLPRAALISLTEEVWFTDLALRPGELEWARNKRKRSKWHWVDHHPASAQFDPERIFDAVSLDDTGTVCAADMVWEMMPKARGFPVLEKWVECAHERDLWLAEDGEFSLGLDILVKEYIGRAPALLLSMALMHPPRALLEREAGKIARGMAEYKKSCKLARNTAERFEVESIPVCICYVSGYASDVGETLYESRDEVLAMIQITGSDLSIAFRTRRDDLNLGELAALFEGGGHPQAAGGRMLDKHLRGGYTQVKRDMQRFLQKKGGGKE